MLQLVIESAMTPAALLHQRTISHFLKTHFLNVEFLPCDVVITILREGLEAACCSTPATSVPGVTNPFVALELLNSSQRELSQVLIALSSSCTCSGSQCPTFLDTSCKKLLAESSSMKAFTDEIQRISTQTLDGQPHVYVGALARAFPKCMSFEDALACIVDMAQSTKSSDAGTPSCCTPACITPNDALSPAAGRPPAGALSPCRMLCLDGLRSPGAPDEDDRPGAFLTAASRRSSVPSQEDCLSGSGALGSSARGLGSTIGTSFWSPRTTMTDGDAIMATAEMPIGPIGSSQIGPERTADMARLLAEHGGWMAESSRCDSVACERELFLDFEGYRPAGVHPSHLFRMHAGFSRFCRICRTCAVECS
jgi:hypothetical protein